MPSTGTPSSSSAGSSRGAPGAYTDAGPPERTRPFGRRRRTSSTPTVWGSSSENTPHSRTRRAISWEYWPPKSSTRTSSRAAALARSSPGARVASASTTPRLWRLRTGAQRRPRSLACRARFAPCVLAGLGPRAPERGVSLPYESRICGGSGRLGHRAAIGHAIRSRCRARGGDRAHADRLIALELLAFGLERRGHHHLGAVEGGDVLVAAGGHRGAEAAHEVEGAVVLVGRPEQDLLERAVLGGLDARAAGKRGMEGGHAPVVAAARGSVGAGEGRADHHGVRPTGEGLGHVAAVAHAAVGDHLDVLA